MVLHVAFQHEEVMHVVLQHVEEHDAVVDLADVVEHSGQRLSVEIHCAVRIVN